MKIAMCQIVSSDDKAANLAQIAEAAHAAAGQGAELAVFPEFAMFYVARLTPEFVEAAEPLDGEFVRELSVIARDAQLTLVAGMHVPHEGRERAVNTLVVVNAAGELVTTYAKQHLYDAFGSRESDVVVAGETGEAVQFEVSGMTVGLLTCYDLRFPEAARVHADAGTDVLVYPAAWMPGPRKEDHWATLARARAIENTMYVVAVSQAPRAGVGGSLATDPNGVVIASLGEAPGVTTVTVDADRIAAVRLVNPSLANRRYGVHPLR